MLARERGDRVTPRDVCEHLLIGRPESVGKAVVDRCRSYLLLGPSGELTDAGRAALEDGKVFIPERGRYRAWYTEDPLLPQRLLDLQPMREPILRDSVVPPISNGAYPRPPPRREREEVINLPDGLQKMEGHVVDLLGPEGGRVEVLAVESRGVRRPPAPSEGLVGSLTLAPNEPPRLRVRGLYDRVLPSPKINHEEAWLSVLGDEARNWDQSSKSPSLRCSFADLKEEERSSFRKTLRIPAPELADYGRFDSAEVPDVPISPRTSRDANAWAEWLLARTIDTYMNESGYQTVADGVRTKFPGFKIEAPEHREMIRKLQAERTKDGRLPEAYWYLQAPLDLQEGRPTLRESRPRRVRGRRKDVGSPRGRPTLREREVEEVELAEEGEVEDDEFGV